MVDPERKKVLLVDSLCDGLLSGPDRAVLSAVAWLFGHAVVNETKPDPGAALLPSLVKATPLFFLCGYV